MRGVLVEQEQLAILDHNSRHANPHPATLPDRSPAMPDNIPALVVIAAGGLGTRVHSWARFIPKEFYPVGGRPAIIRLLEEIGTLGPARVAIVYHPYYEQFAAWGRQALSPSGRVCYSREAGLDIPAAVPPGVNVALIPQHGP